MEQDYNRKDYANWFKTFVSPIQKEKTAQHVLSKSVESNSSLKGELSKDGLRSDFKKLKIDQQASGEYFKAYTNNSISIPPSYQKTKPRAGK